MLYTLLNHRHQQCFKMMLTDNPIPTAAPLTLPNKIIQPITPELKPKENNTRFIIRLQPVIT